jgi:hypothetical protein
VPGETRVETVQRDLADRDEALRQLKNQLLKAQQERMKMQTDKKRIDRSFVVGEWVFLKLRAHKQQSVVTRINAKLSARYYGPYPIIERIGVVAYRLKLPEGSRVHPVFHVSLLKKAIGNYHEEQDLPALLDEPIEVKQVLVHWKGKTTEEATWEEEIMIRNQFPKFNLEDKVAAEGEGIDRTLVNEENPPQHMIHHRAHGPKIWKVYSRRGKGVNA